MTEILKEIYFNAQHPASFGGIKRLQNATPRMSNHAVKTFLNQQWTYQFHKPIRQNFKRRHYITRGVNEQHQADLVEMQPYARENKGYRYILCVIDIFSRYAYARPLKTKTGPDVASALREIFTESAPKYLQTDQGKEFYNQHVQSMLKEFNIELFSVYSDKKAAIVERFQRTLQDRMYRAFTYQRNYKWLDILPQLIESYNHSYHRSIKTMPATINESNETKVWFSQYKKVEKNPSPKYEVGDSVRIPKHKTIFTKGYIEKWTDEIFTIHSINTKYKPELYTLKDEYGEILKGSFYNQELQKVENSEKLYRIEKVIRTKTVNGKKQTLVKWKGYKEPTWIDSNAIVPI